MAITEVYPSVIISGTGSHTPPPEDPPVVSPDEDREIAPEEKVEPEVAHTDPEGTIVDSQKETEDVGTEVHQVADGDVDPGQPAAAPDVDAKPSKPQPKPKAK